MKPSEESATDLKSWKARLPQVSLNRFIILSTFFFFLGLSLFFFFTYSYLNFENSSYLVFLGLFFTILLIGFCLTLYLQHKWILAPFSEMAERVTDWQPLIGKYFKEVEKTPNETAQMEVLFHQIQRFLRKQNRRLGFEKIKLTTLLDSLADPIVAIDKKKRVIAYNPAFIKVFPHHFQDNVKEEVTKVFKNPEILSYFFEVLGDGKTREIPEIRLRVGEVKDITFDVSFTPLIGEEGNTIGVLAIFHDISKVKRVDQMRMDFVANVSHEVRTPLTAIKGAIDILKRRKEEFSEDSYDFIQSVSNNNERLYRLFKDLLDLSLLEGQVDEVEREDWNLAEITEGVIQAIRGGYSEKKIDIVFASEIELIRADKKMIEQVLINLIQNAIRYTQQTGQVKVSWRPYEEGALLEVKDQGPGIDKVHHDRLFERFYRVDSSRSKELGGTGLGLAIVKHCALRHGGRVWVESEPGKGASFFVYIPQNL